MGGRERGRRFRRSVPLLSVRDPQSWYRSASNTIFPVITNPPADLAPWMETMRMLLRERFSDRLDDEGAMMDAFERHNDAVREATAPERLLEWSPGDGWEPTPYPWESWSAYLPS